MVLKHKLWGLELWDSFQPKRFNDSVKHHIQREHFNITFFPTFILLASSRLPKILNIGIYYNASIIWEILIHLHAKKHSLMSCKKSWGYFLSKALHVNLRAKCAPISHFTIQSDKALKILENRIPTMPFICEKNNRTRKLFPGNNLKNKN